MNKGVKSKEIDSKGDIARDIYSERDIDIQRQKGRDFYTVDSESERKIDREKEDQ